MDSEKILFCYREDEEKSPCLLETGESNKVVAAIPCMKTVLGRKVKIRAGKVKKQIARIFEALEAQYLWMDDALCEFLQLEKTDLPEKIIEDWLSKIPFNHTLIFADDGNMRAMEYILKRTEKLAAVSVVCYEKYVSDYENLAMSLFQREGIVLQIFTYEELERRVHSFREHVILKGRAALLDFEDRRSFWNRRLEKEISYYSFLNENRLFLDTFRKNRYNTLTK